MGGGEGGVCCCFVGTSCMSETRCIVAIYLIRGQLESVFTNKVEEREREQGFAVLTLATCD